MAPIPNKTAVESQPVICGSGDCGCKKEIANYGLLADLFEYPRNGFNERIKNIQKYLDAEYPEAGQLLLPFSMFTGKSSVKESEELFTRSFDVQAITTLDIGYIMFGDDYKRAEILVNLNREHREVNNECGTELSDHLPNVLRLIYKAQEKPFILDLIEFVVGPCIVKMRNEFTPDKLQKKSNVYVKHHKTLIEMSREYGTLYKSTLNALYWVLQKDFGIKEKKQPVQTTEFLKSINTELEIEKS